MRASSFFRRNGAESSRRCFTLVEVLVVLTIVVVLAALLAPGFSSAMRTVKATKCASNLKQVGIAFLSYASDHDGYLPPNPYPGSPSFWTGQIRPYLGVASNAPTPQILQCPAYTPAPKNQTYAINGLLYTNVGGSFYSSTSPRIAMLPHPSQTVALYDCSDGALVYGYHAALMAQSFVRFRHPHNTANFLMVDGSVTALSSNMVCTNDAYWNSP